VISHSYVSLPKGISWKNSWGTALNVEIVESCGVGKAPYRVIFQLESCEAVTAYVTLGTSRDAVAAMAET